VQYALFHTHNECVQSRRGRDGWVEAYYHNNNEQPFGVWRWYMYALFKYVHVLYIYIIIVSLSFTGVAILLVRIKKVYVIEKG
jgi:hypothetical protein